MDVPLSTCREGSGFFIELFQFIMTKTFSEAIAETVGSIMKIHSGRSRNLHPTNFDKEIYIQYNLPERYRQRKDRSREKRIYFEEPSKIDVH